MLMEETGRQDRFRETERNNMPEISEPIDRLNSRNQQEIDLHQSLSSYEVPGRILGQPPEERSSTAIRNQQELIDNLKSTRNTEEQSAATGNETKFGSTGSEQASLEELQKKYREQDEKASGIKEEDLKPLKSFILDRKQPMEKTNENNEAKKGEENESDKSENIFDQNKSGLAENGRIVNVPGTEFFSGLVKIPETLLMKPNP